MITCTQCGECYPNEHNKTNSKCGVCRTLLDPQYCKKCGEVKPLKEFNTYIGQGARYRRQACKKCELKRIGGVVTRWRQNNKIKVADRFEAWKGMLATISFTPLTELEWLATCKHFNGCAFCNDQHIETREFFIKFKHGGRYAVWNMIPMCRACAMGYKRVQNPFKMSYKRLMSKAPCDKETLEKICTYLKEKAVEYGAKIESI